MRIGHSSDTKEATQSRQHLSGDLETIRGDCSAIWGRAAIEGDVSGLKGCIAGLTGRCNGLAGDVSRLRGNISGITGSVDSYLVGNVSGLRGDVTDVWGNADGLRGQVADLVDQGLLWPKGQPLTLETFASRYRLPMEFFDNSGLPALIAFHALEGPPLHWLTVRSDTVHGFIVGPLLEIRKRFPGQEIAKVAIPSEANWQICDDLVVFRTDRVYVLEHVEPLVSAFTN